MKAAINSYKRDCLRNANRDPIQKRNSPSETVNRYKILYDLKLGMAYNWHMNGIWTGSGLGSELEPEREPGTRPILGLCLGLDWAFGLDLGLDLDLPGPGAELSHSPIF